MLTIKNKKSLASLAVAALLLLVLILAWPQQKSQPRNSALINTDATAAAKQPAIQPPTYSIDEASSIWVVVNKGRALPSDYVPAGLRAPDVPLRLPAANPEMMLRSDAAASLETMFKAAKADGISLMLESGYRSYSEQLTVYQGYVKASGQAQADTYSARPGHSEHQTGLAADIEPLSRYCEVEQCFENTPEGKWLDTHAYQYGFIIRYAKGADTGYEYEPWHVRFVGTDLSKKIFDSHKTLEQYFNLPVYDTYPGASYALKNI